MSKHNLRAKVAPFPFPLFLYFPGRQLHTCFYSVNSLGQWGGFRVQPPTQEKPNCEVSAKRQQQLLAASQSGKIFPAPKVSPAGNPQGLYAADAMQNATRIGEEQLCQASPRSLPSGWAEPSLRVGSRLSARTPPQWLISVSSGLNVESLRKDQYLGAALKRLKTVCNNVILYKPTLKQLGVHRAILMGTEVLDEMLWSCTTLMDSHTPSKLPL